MEEVPRVVGAELEQMIQSRQGWKGHSGPRPQHVQRPAECRHGNQPSVTETDRHRDASLIVIWPQRPTEAMG